MIFHFNPDHGPGRRQNGRSIDALRLEDLICSNIETLCRHFFPAGKRVNGQWRVASSPRIGRKRNRPGSLAIHLEGNFKGCWRDWSSRQHGSFIRLVMARHNLSFPDAARAIGSCLGTSIERPVHEPGRKLFS
jgi:hypothetical protein